MVAALGLQTHRGTCAWPQHEQRVLLAAFIIIRTMRSIGTRRVNMVLHRAPRSGVKCGRDWSIERKFSEMGA